MCTVSDNFPDKTKMYHQSYTLLELTMSMSLFCSETGKLGANITFHIKMTNYD